MVLREGCYAGWVACWQMHEDEKRRRLALLDRPYTYDALFEMVGGQHHILIQHHPRWRCVGDVILCVRGRGG